MAQDKGYPPLSRTVEVQIDVVDRANNPPVWDHTIYGPIYVKENMPVGGKVVAVKARSVNIRKNLFLFFFVLSKECSLNFMISMKNSFANDDAGVDEITLNFHVQPNVLLRRLF